MFKYALTKYRFHEIKTNDGIFQKKMLTLWNTLLQVHTLYVTWEKIATARG